MLANMLKRHTVGLYGILAAIMLAGPACAADKADTNNDGQEKSRATETTAARPDTKEKGEPAVQSPQDKSSSQKKDQEIIDVYLFHGSYRCFSCNKMEALTQEAIEESFAQQKKNGTVRFQHVNVEEDGNRHFIQDYNISAISIILSQKAGDKEKQWKNLDKVWVLLRNEEKFKEYVVNEIKAYL